MDFENSLLAEKVHTIIRKYVAQAVELELLAQEAEEASTGPSDYTAVNNHIKYREAAGGIWIRVERLQKIAKSL